MIALVFLATVINYLDRQTLSVVAPVLRDEFRMSNETYGRVVAAFMLAYTVMNGVSGPLIDRLGTRVGYALVMAWWSAAGMLHALARGPLSLGLCRFLLGMGEAGNWPAGVKVVAEWFPPKERALASGIFNSGSAIGALVAPPLVAGIVLRWGWPWAFLGVGATGFVWLVAWWLLYDTPVSARTEAQPAPVPAWGLFRTRFVWTFTLSKVFMDPVWYFYIFWFPEYLRRARGFDLAAIGRYAWIPFLAADVGNLAGGWLSGALIRRGFSLNVARKSSVTLFALLMTSAIPAVLAADARVSIGCVALASFGYTGALANMLSFPADVYPKHVVGSVYGLASMGSGFGGMVFAQLTGWVIDHYSYVPVFFAFGLMPLVCALILWTLLGPIRPRAEELPRPS
jgi:ACS family hexuronate transporter-like MFS transporter